MDGICRFFIVLCFRIWAGRAYIEIFFAWLWIFEYLKFMDTIDYKRIFYLIAKRNQEADTEAEHAELDEWIYGNTDCPRIMFALFIDPQYADSFEQLAASLRP